MVFTFLGVGSAVVHLSFGQDAADLSFQAAGVGAVVARLTAVGGSIRASSGGFVAQGLEFFLNLVVGDFVDVGFALLQAVFTGFQLAFASVVLALLGRFVGDFSAGSFFADKVVDVALFAGQTNLLGVEVGLVGIQSTFVVTEFVGLVGVQLIAAGLGEAVFVGEFVVEGLLLFGQLLGTSVERLGTVFDVGVTGLLFFSQVGLVGVQSVAQFIHQVAALVLLQEFLADAVGFGHSVDTGVNHIGDFPATDTADDTACGGADSGSDESGSGDGADVEAVEDAAHGFDAGCGGQTHGGSTGGPDENTGSAEDPLGGGHKLAFFRDDRLLGSFLFARERRECSGFLTEVAQGAFDGAGTESETVADGLGDESGQFITDHPSTGGQGNETETDSDLSTGAHGRESGFDGVESAT